MLSKTNLTLTVVVWVTAALLATGALAGRPGPGLVPPHNPNQPSVQTRLGNIPTSTPDPTIGGAWSPLATGFPGTSPDTALLLTDGRIPPAAISTALGVPSRPATKNPLLRCPLVTPRFFTPLRCCRMAA